MEAFLGPCIIIDGPLTYKQIKAQTLQLHCAQVDALGPLAPTIFCAKVVSEPSGPESRPGGLLQNRRPATVLQRIRCRTVGHRRFCNGCVAEPSATDGSATGTSQNRRPPTVLQRVRCRTVGHRRFCNECVAEPSATAKSPRIKIRFGFVVKIVTSFLLQVSPPSLAL